MSVISISGVICQQSHAHADVMTSRGPCLPRIRLRISDQSISL